MGINGELDSVAEQSRSSVVDKGANPDYQIREKEWRFTDGRHDDARAFMKLAIGSSLSSEVLGQLMQLGDKLANETGDVRDSARQIQEYRLRVGENLRENIDEVLRLSPELGAQLRTLRRIGVCPIFRGEAPKGGGGTRFSLCAESISRDSRKDEGRCQRMSNVYLFSKDDWHGPESYLAPIYDSPEEDNWPRYVRGKDVGRRPQRRKHFYDERGLPPNDGPQRANHRQTRRNDEKALSRQNIDVRKKRYRHRVSANLSTP